MARKMRKYIVSILYIRLCRYKLPVNLTSVVTVVISTVLIVVLTRTYKCPMASLLLWSSDRHDQENRFIIREWQCLWVLDGGWKLDPWKSQHPTLHLPPARDGWLKNVTACALCAPYTQQVKIAPFVPSRISTARGCMAFCISKEQTFRQFLKKSIGYLYCNREFFICYDTIVVSLIIGIKWYTLPESTCKLFKEPSHRFLAWRAGAASLFDVPARQAI
jgi:hypothetical protein